MATILPLFDSSPQASFPASSVGSDLLDALAELQTQEVALRGELVKDSWEDAYHQGIRIELAGAAFHVLAALPLSESPASFLATTRTTLTTRLEQLQAAATPPYTASAHGHFDAIAQILTVLDRFLEIRLDTPTL